MAVAPQRGLPVPPQPMIPPEGLPPPPEATAPDASPTTMVLNYLQSRGFPPTTDNVRRALEANARDPGVIPGLRSDVPATEADDQAAMAAAGVGGGRRGGGGAALPKVAGTPAGGQGDQRVDVPGAPGKAPDVSSNDIAKWALLGGVPALGAAAGAYAWSRRGQNGEPVEEPGKPTSEPVGEGKTSAAPEASAPTAMEAQMQRAIATPGSGAEPLPGVAPVPGMANMPPQGPVSAADAPPLPFSSPQPRVAPDAPFVRSGPPGINLQPPAPIAGPPEVPIGASGMTASPPPAPNVPFTQRPGGAPRVRPNIELGELGTRVLRGLRSVPR